MKESKPLGHILFKNDLSFKLIKFFYENQGKMVTFEDLMESGFKPYGIRTWDRSQDKLIYKQSVSITKALESLHRNNVIFRDNEFYMYAATDKVDKEVRGILGVF